MEYNIFCDKCGRYALGYDRFCEDCSKEELKEKNNYVIDIYKR